MNPVLSKEVEAQLSKEANVLVERLMEYGCDSAALFITWPCPEGITGSRAVRRGNYYAQRGHIQDWIDAVKQKEQAEAIADEVLIDSDDDYGSGD